MPIQVDADGTVYVPAHKLPLSAALSEQSRSYMAAALSRGQRTAIPGPHDFATEAEFKVMVDGFREAMDSGHGKAMSDRLLEQFPVTIAPGTIGGVPVEEFTPPNAMDKDRVLINLHGGAFYAGAVYIGRWNRSIASLGKFRVISVDYRQGYEHKFPARSEDVAAVYAELLKDYVPSQVGIYGGSAGGVLTAQATAWILDKGMPAPAPLASLVPGRAGPVIATTSLPMPPACLLRPGYCRVLRTHRWGIFPARSMRIFW